MKQVIRMAVVLIFLFAAMLLFANWGQGGVVTFDLGSDVRATISFVVFGLALVGAFIMLQLLGALLALPRQLVRGRRERRNKRLRGDFEHGVALYLQGRWEQAYKSLLRTSRGPSLAHNANLMAARCAVQNDCLTEARAALQAAREANTMDDFGVLLIQSEVLLKSGQCDQAAEHLGKLHKLQPDNRRVTDLLVSACKTMDNWGILTESLPQLRKLYADRHDTLREIEISVAREHLQQVADQMDRGALERCWRKTGASAKPALLTTYAQMLVNIGASKKAEHVLHEAIESSWNEDCMICYGDLESDDIDKRLDHAKRWFEAKPKNPVLLLCLGKLYRQAGLWDQARHHLEASFSLAPRPDTFTELTSVVDYIEGDSS